MDTDEGGRKSTRKTHSLALAATGADGGVGRADHLLALAATGAEGGGGRADHSLALAATGGVGGRKWHGVA